MVHDDVNRVNLANETQAEVARFSARLDEALAAALGEGDPLSEAARPLVLARAAKRARARVALWVGEALGAPADVVLDAAVAVELIHAASLLHDDVVDGATVRRGMPSANARFGASVAVLSGDLLLTAAIARLQPHGPEATARALEVVAEMTRAVGVELAARRRVDFSLDDWRCMAEGKTGALFGLAAWLVARAAGDELRARACDGALRHLGVAFQIADDLGDLVPAGGETPYQDLRDGNPSFPVLVAARRSAAVRAALEAAWHGPDAGDWRALAVAVLATEAPVIAGAAVHDELLAARRLLGEDAARPGIAAILRWAETLAAPAAAGYLAADAAPVTSIPRALTGGHP